MSIINIIELNHIELLMKSFIRPWFIAGGWTIDLAIGELTRAHKDMDICIFREDLDYAIAFFGEWKIKIAIPGEHRLVPFQTLSDVEEDEHDFKVYLDRVNDEHSKKWLLESMIVVNGNKSWIEALYKKIL